MLDVVHQGLRGWEPVVVVVGVELFRPSSLEFLEALANPELQYDNV